MTATRVAPGVAESFVRFRCGDDDCLGVVARPAAASAVVGVLIVVGGPQYRAGSHRQFVLLARDLAAQGISVLRFDYRGMGDSDGAPRTFAGVSDDLRAAIDSLARETGVTRVVLWGLCDGASAALMYAAGDPRVAGIVAVNPWVRSDATLATTRLRHYYLKRLLIPAFWGSLLRGNVSVTRSVGDLADTVRAAASPAPAAAFLDAMHAGWRALAAPVLFVLSGRDLTAREFEAWTAADRGRTALLQAPATTVLAVPEADHTFSSADARAALTRATLAFVAPLCRAS